MCIHYGVIEWSRWLYKHKVATLHLIRWREEGRGRVQDILHLNTFYILNLIIFLLLFNNT